MQMFECIKDHKSPLRLETWEGWNFKKGHVFCGQPHSAKWLTTKELPRNAAQLFIRTNYYHLCATHCLGCHRICMMGILSPRTISVQVPVWLM